MTTHALTINKLRWLTLAAETNQQIQAIQNRIVNQRLLSLWQRYEICAKNLSHLELQRSQGQSDLHLHNQIEEIVKEIAEIESEIKGEEGFLFHVNKLFCETPQKSESFPYSS